MSAPIAALPATDNDSRPARPVCFTNSASAVAYASRSARLASPSGIYVAVEFQTNTFQPREGGTAYQVALGVLDWEVLEVAPTEVARRVQAGLRAAIERCNSETKAHDLVANAAKPGSSYQRMHAEKAAAVRGRARELALRLTVGVARALTPSAWSDEDKFYRRDVPGAKLQGAE